MVSEITLLLKHGWVNLWKNKILWIFSSLVLIDPLVRLIVPISKMEDLSSAFFFLILSTASIYLMFMSYAGVSFVAYCTTISEPVDLVTAFKRSTNLFWRVVGLSFLLVLIIAPCLFIVLIASYKEPFQIKDLAHSIFLLSIPLSLFAAMWYFPIIEIVANGSKISKSLKPAWKVFTDNFVALATLGFALAVASHVINISVSAFTMLAQSGFDFTILSKLDFMSPHLSVTNNNVYKLVSSIIQAVWRTYIVSIFTFAYLKYSGAKMSKRSTA